MSSLAVPYEPSPPRRGREVEIHGWTPHMPRLMAENHLVISKAGGATVQETLAAKTPMIITQVVPGQEEGNARLLIENDAGALATTPADIASTVSSAFASGGAKWNELAFQCGKTQPSQRVGRDCRLYSWAEPLSSGLRNGAVWLLFDLATCSGVPVAMISPPRDPASGPTSTM